MSRSGSVVRRMLWGGLQSARGFSPAAGPTRFEPPAEYSARRARFVEQLAAARAEGGAVRLQKSTSNLFRVRDCAGARRIDAREFDHVLGIDHAALIGDVEGMTTYEAFADAALRDGAIPAVTPELKTITVGGAVSGLGIESSSFRYGLAHENVREMEVATGDGRVLTCSAAENTDLFDALPNSYGTLGYILRLRTSVVAARPYVRVDHTRFSQPSACLSHLRGLCEGGTADFVEGVAFGPDELYSTAGAMQDAAPWASRYDWMNIYYKSIREKTVDYMTTRQYLWRWDTDWFWCSSRLYAQDPVVRAIAGRRFLNSRTYQRVMRLAARVLPDSGAEESVIQDVAIPIESAAEFLSFLFRDIGVLPIWMCPFRMTRVWPLYRLEPRRLYVNFGFWGSVRAGSEPGQHNRKVEDVADQLGGRKGLYSSCWYDEATFWRLHDGDTYRRVKARYDPDGALGDLYAKCVRGR